MIRSVWIALLFTSVYIFSIQETNSFLTKTSFKRTTTAWLQTSSTTTTTTTTTTTSLETKEELKGTTTTSPEVASSSDTIQKDLTSFGTTTTTLHNDTDTDISNLSTKQIKQLLLDLIPRMTGTPQECRFIESYVNTLESKYIPPQTLDFLNLAIQGDWQLLFSTTLLANGGGGRLPRQNFRLRELLQKVRPDGFNGTITNVATWDFAENNLGNFDISGTFSIPNHYTIQQGARMTIVHDDDEEDPTLKIKPGSNGIPQDISGLVALLKNSIPSEMFEPKDHSIDTTYLDGDLKIVRFTGLKYEAVRDIFIRRGNII